MKLRYLRLAIVAIVVGCFFFYFVPVVPVSAAFSCGGGALCLSNPSVFISLGYSLFHWGGVYSPESGYITPTMSIIIGGVTTWVTLGWFEVYLFIPIGCVLVGLLSPEIVDGVHVVSMYLGELVGRGSPKSQSA